MPGPLCSPASSQEPRSTHATALGINRAAQTSSTKQQMILLFTNTCPCTGRFVKGKKKAEGAKLCKRCPMISPASQQQSGAATCTARRRHSNYEFHNRCLLISTVRSGCSQSDMYETQVQVKQRYTNTGFSSSVAATEANTNTPIIDQALLFHVSRGCSGWSGGDGGGRQRFRHSSPVITLSPGVR